MGIVVQKGRKKAFFRQGQWWSPYPEFENELNHLTNMWIEETGGPEIGSKNPERDAARQVVRQTGARIVLTSKLRGNVTAKIFFSRRQMRLWP